MSGARNKFEEKSGSVHLNELLFLKATNTKAALSLKVVGSGCGTTEPA